MDAVFTQIIAVVGCAGGVIGTIIAIRAEIRASKADARATSAEQRSVQAQKAAEVSEAREYWTALIAVSQKLVGANVAYQNMHPVLVELRAAMTELIDSPANSECEHLAPWLHMEHKMINGLFAEAQSTLLKIQARPTVDQLDSSHRRVNKWLEGFIGNLRAARMACGKELDDSQFKKLEQHAQEQYAELLKANPGLIPPPPKA